MPLADDLDGLAENNHRPSAAAFVRKDPPRSFFSFPLVSVFAGFSVFTLVLLFHFGLGTFNFHNHVFLTFQTRLPYRYKSIPDTIAETTIQHSISLPQTLAKSFGAYGADAV